MSRLPFLSVHEKVYGSNMKYLMIFSLFANLVFADAISTTYTGTITYCDPITVCQAMTQDGLTFTDGSTTLDLWISTNSFGSGIVLSVEDGFITGGGGYFTGPAFDALTTIYETVTVTGGSGQGYIALVNSSEDSCEGEPEELIAECSITLTTTVPTISTPGYPGTEYLFTYDTPFNVVVNLADGLQIGPETGYAATSVLLYPLVFDTSGDLMTDATVTIVDPSGPDAPEPTTCIIVAGSLTCLYRLRRTACSSMGREEVAGSKSGLGHVAAGASLKGIS